MPYTAEQRKKLIDGLTTNCGSDPKGSVFVEADRPYLEKASDQKLSALVRQTLKANAEKDDEEEDDDDDDDEKTKNAGGDDHSFDTPGMKGSSAQAGQKGTDKLSGDGAEYSDEKSLKVNAWYKKAPAAVREVFDDAFKMRGQEKVRLIEHIITNSGVRGDKKAIQTEKEWLASKPLPELRRMARYVRRIENSEAPLVHGMLPVDPVQMYLHGNYSGAAGVMSGSHANGGAVTNVEQGDVLLDTPVINWAQALEEQGARVPDRLKRQITHKSDLVA